MKNLNYLNLIELKTAFLAGDAVLVHGSRYQAIKGLAAVAANRGVKIPAFLGDWENVKALSPNRYYLLQVEFIPGEWEDGTPIRYLHFRRGIDALAEGLPAHIGQPIVAGYYR